MSSPSTIGGAVREQVGEISTSTSRNTSTVSSMNFRRRALVVDVIDRRDREPRFDPRQNVAVLVAALSQPLGVVGGGFGDDRQSARTVGL